MLTLEIRFTAFCGLSLAFRLWSAERTPQMGVGWRAVHLIDVPARYIYGRDFEFALPPAVVVCDAGGFPGA